MHSRLMLFNIIKKVKEISFHNLLRQNCGDHHLSIISSSTFAKKHEISGGKDQHVSYIGVYNHL